MILVVLSVCVCTCVCAHMCVLSGAVCMWMGGPRHHMAFFGPFHSVFLRQSLSQTLKPIQARLPGASDLFAYWIPAQWGL